MSNEKNIGLTAFEKDIRDRLDGLQKEVIDEIFDDMTSPKQELESEDES